MTKKEKNENFIEKYNGYLITSLVCNEDISKTYVAKFIKEYGMEKVLKGVYIADDEWPDELFILQQRNNAVIYSGETALYLHGLTDREYSSVCVTVPQGYNASHLKKKDFEITVKYATQELYKLGVCEIASSSGNLVKAYDKERCICDLIVNRNKYELQIFQTVIKEYMSSKDKQLSKLMVYAELKDNVITPKAVEYDYKLMFEDRTISVLTYNKETLLAEKMQTIINRGIVNTRLRDFYDVYSIMNVYGGR